MVDCYLLQLYRLCLCMCVGLYVDVCYKHCQNGFADGFRPYSINDSLDVRRISLSFSHLGPFVSPLELAVMWTIIIRSQTHLFLLHYLVHLNKTSEFNCHLALVTSFLLLAEESYTPCCLL